MADTQNPFQQDLDAKRAELQAAFDRRADLQHQLHDVPAGAIGMGPIRAGLIAAISAMDVVVTRLQNELATLQGQFNDFEAHKHDLMAGGLTEEAALAQLNAEASAKGLLKSILIYTVVAVVTGLIIWGLVKLYRRMKQ